MDPKIDYREKGHAPIPRGSRIRIVDYWQARERSRYRRHQGPAEKRRRIKRLQREQAISEMGP